MHPSPDTYCLPNLHSICRWKASLNLHLEVVAADSVDWLLSYVYRIPELQNKAEVLKRTSGELLAAYTFPHADAERLRVCTNFINLLFVIDEITDVQSGLEAKSTIAVCEMTDDFRRRIVPFVNDATWYRFLNHFEDYLNSVGEEAKLREQGTVLELKAYEIQRRNCSAVFPIFALIGYALDLDLPNEVFHHPAYMEMHVAAVDMVTWSNDLYSYRIERSSGQSACNILTVLQNERGITLQEAADAVGVHFDTLVKRFNTAKSRLPILGEELDGITSKFVQGLEDWVVGNLDWSFASQRYFGNNHEQVKETLSTDPYSQRTA